MYICDNCGCTCDDDDLPIYEEDYGFETGIGFKSMKQTFVDNCSCGGNFVEAQECEMCGEYFAEDDLEGGVCKECLEQNATFDNAIELGDENKDTVEINGFYASAFTLSEIEEILKRELVEAKKLAPDKINTDAKNYCLDDKSYFGEWLSKDT